VQFPWRKQRREKRGMWREALIFIKKKKLYLITLLFYFYFLNLKRAATHMDNANFSKKIECHLIEKDPRRTLVDALAIVIKKWLKLSCGK
jgi:hypothetical protein